MFARHDPSDPINVLEALYDLEQPRDTWFRGVLEASGAALDRGAGVGLVLYDVSGKTPRLNAIDAMNLSVDHVKVGIDTHEEPAFAQSIVKSYRNDVCATLADHVGDPEVLRAVRERYARVGIRDQIRINGANHSGFGCALYVFSKACLHLTTSERELMSRIAAHLATAYRLKRRLEQAPNTGEGGVDAVLRVDGRLEHVESAASSRESRQSLVAAAKLREWARTPSRRSDTERATAAWKPLVCARWSFVDRYERNGQRYITARANAPAPAGLEALSPREREVASLAGLGHSNKLIAYELGVAHSTVRVLLARAAHKLGARTRAEIISQIRARG